MWAVCLFCATFVLQVTSDVLVGSLHEGLGKDLGFRTQVDSTLTRKLVWHVVIISTLISTHTNRTIWGSYQ